jgi:hypothetical protein
MKSPLLGFAVVIVREWTRLYTWRLPPTLREARRAEIESDLWEFEHDVTARARSSPAMQVLLRVVAGVPDDLQWRVEQVVAGDKRLRTTIALTATAFLVVALWALNALRPPELPPLPASAHLPNVELVSPPPPPPPPPPPCRPGASTVDCPP